MDEVQVLAGAEAAQVGGTRFNREIDAQREERLQPENGVIKIADAGAVLKAAVWVQPLAQKGSDHTAASVVPVKSNLGDQYANWFIGLLRMSQRFLHFV